MMRLVLLFFGQLLYVPHVLLFLSSSQKSLVIADLYARCPTRKSGFVVVYDLTFTLLVNSYFRTLFYFRTVGFFSKILRIFYPKHPSFIIDVHTAIGGGLQLAHPYSTILNATSIGTGVYVNHLVTVGEKNGQRPVIGNGVQLHAGCIVIGGISLGDGAVVGAGAVVTKDVPAFAVVVGNPARVLSNKTDLNVVS